MPHLTRQYSIDPSKRHLLGLGAAALAMHWVPTVWAQDAAASNLQDEVWTDKARSRDLPTLLRWPTGLDGSVKGVILFSHGMGGNRQGADVWGQAWAAAGFCVVHLQHPGSDAPAMKGGFSALRKAMAPEQLLARVADVKFVMDEIQRRHDQKQARWDEVPVKKLGFAGHSFGARTAQALAGQAYPNGGGWQGTEPRLAAFAMFSPALGKTPQLPQATADARSMTRPTLVITGTLDGEVLNNGETPETRRMVYDCLPAGKKALLLIKGADHLTFAGVAKQIPSTILLRREPPTMQAEAQHHDRIAKISTQWWKTQLLGAALPDPLALATGDIWLKG